VVKHSMLPTFNWDGEDIFFKCSFSSKRCSTCIMMMMMMEGSVIISMAVSSRPTHFTLKMVPTQFCVPEDSKIRLAVQPSSDPALSYCLPCLDSRH